MNQSLPHRFTLEPYAGSKSRHTCPKCQHRFKTFKYYIDTQTGDYLADHVGRCDREEQCGYHYTPREYFKAYPAALKGINPATIKWEPPTSYFDTISAGYLERSMKHYDRNNFVCFLHKMFSADDVDMLVKKYNIGTSKLWPGSTVFWQMDTNGKLRTGKIMLYNAETGKRVKEPVSRITWAHLKVGSRQLAVGSDASKYAVGSGQLAVANDAAASCQLDTANSQHDCKLPTANCQLPTANFELRQCLFGEHLLSLDPFKPVAIAESEKTAIIASMYLPKYIWLAAGSLEGLTANKCKVLTNRTVTLFPDVNGYAKWHSKVYELRARVIGAIFTIYETLQRTATPEEIAKGIDIADRWIDAEVNGER